jgi:hypothetical protein
MKKTRARYTVITVDEKGLTKSRLGRWVSRAEAERVADLWKRHGMRPMIISTDPSERAVERDFDRKALMRGIDKDLKAANRDKLASLRTKIKEALVLQRSGRAGLTDFCSLERQRGRQRIEALKAELKAAAASIRLEARGSCERARRAPRLEVARLREELAAERKFIEDMRRIEAQSRARARRPGFAKAKVRQSESDDEVRANLPPDLVPLFNRVRRSIKGSPRKSRTEAFLQYVEEHPGEEYEAIEGKTDALVRELERQQRAGRRDPGSRHRHRRPGAPTFRQQKLIARKMRILIREGRSPKQAAAIAYRMAGIPPRRA